VAIEIVGADLPTDTGSRDLEGEDLGLEDDRGNVVEVSTARDAEAEPSCTGGGKEEDTDMTGPF
jgi:hypothetical protein